MNAKSTIMNKVNIRNSNVELLRIIAMLFIIMHHFLTHGMHILQNNSWENFLFVSLNSLCYIGCVVFVLISGYYGIKFDWIKLLRLYILTASIGGICYIAHLLIDDASFGKSVIYNTFFSISHTKNWFLKIYFYLFLFSPILNIALNACNKNKSLFILFVLTFICVYFGWFWQDELYSDGCNLVNFVWIYCIGDYLKRYYNKSTLSPIVYLLIWIVCSIYNSVMSIMFNTYHAFTYNNPLVIAAAISFFLFFISYDFVSKLINSIAMCTLGVYLIHEKAFISPIIYGQEISSIYSTNIFYFLLSVVICFSACSLIDMALRKIVVSPIMKCFSRVYLVLRKRLKRQL